MSSFNTEAINNSMGKLLTEKDADVRAASELDLTDSANLIKFQQAIGDWGNATSLCSTTIKSLSDAISGVIQKM